MGGESQVAIAVLLPDVLGSYSDAGNAVVLAQRLRWRGVEARVIVIDAADTAPESCDVYLLGGGEDTARERAAEWLRSHPHLATTLTDRAVTFAVCAGLQLLGHATTGDDGTSVPGVGVLDVHTRRGPRCQVGEPVATSGLPGVGVVTGFHNHRGASLLGPDAQPLAHTEHGPSNHPDSPDEGALSPPGPTVSGRSPGVVATYLHGPVLARNPALGDYLLARAVGGPLPELDPARLPDLTALRRSHLATRARTGRTEAPGR